MNNNELCFIHSIRIIYVWRRGKKQKEKDNYTHFFFVTKYAL
jgi:hypothetical protein